MIRYGDLQLLPNHDDYLIIACDSSGSIGNKEKDIVQIKPELAGYFAAFVPIVEVLAIKGNILSIVNTLCVEMNPTGNRIIEGIKEAMVSIGLDSSLLTGSTEDNMPSTSTGIGVTVIGTIKKEELQQKKIHEGDMLYLVGIPKVGQEFLDEEVLNNFQETLSLELMVELKREKTILDMLPVGSKGIAYESDIFAKRHHLKIGIETFEFKGKAIDFSKSAGPSTCLLIALKKEDTQAFVSKYNKIPIHPIGVFKK